MSEADHAWEPGAHAIYRSWQNRSNYEVKVIRYSRRRSSHDHLVCVQRVSDGHRFTIHDQFLVPVGRHGEDPTVGGMDE
jgi:hypothetical protein